MQIIDNIEQTLSLIRYEKSHSIYLF